jgi:hypothetical protein
MTLITFYELSAIKYTRKDDADFAILSYLVLFELKNYKEFTGFMKKCSLTAFMDKKDLFQYFKVINNLACLHKFKENWSYIYDSSYIQGFINSLSEKRDQIDRYLCRVDKIIKEGIKIQRIHKTTTRKKKSTMLP